VSIAGHTPQLSGASKPGRCLKGGRLDNRKPLAGTSPLLASFKNAINRPENLSIHNKVLELVSRKA
jgi:hypothetical protein